MTSLELVRKLVAHGANPNARIVDRSNIRLSRVNPLGATPLLLAARTADAELMRELVALGADPRITNADNTTILLVAAGVGTHHPGEDPGSETEVLEAVKLALDLGADINAVDNKGETAMHGAAYKHVPAVAQFLIDQGAKIDVWNRKNDFGSSPLMIAEGYKDGNFEPSAETAAVIRSVMSAAGLSTVVDPGSLLSPNRAEKD
jgi:ankyrin repeat protein